MRLDARVLDDEELILALEERIDPDIKASHHRQIPSNLLQFLLVVVQVDGLDAEEILPIILVKAVEEDAIEVLVQLTGRVLH